MGTTRIMELANETTMPVYYNNKEYPKEIRVEPGHRVAIDHDVPWCTNKDAFPGHHIVLSNLPSHNPAYIWQHYDDDGDYIRYSDDGQFHSTATDNGKPAWRVAGDSGVNGFRSIRVTYNGDFEFIVVQGPSHRIL